MVSDEASHLVMCFAERVQTIVPPGFTLEEKDGAVVVRSENVREFLPLGERIDHSRRAHDGRDAKLLDAFVNTLDDLQDIVSTTLGVPWPTEPLDQREFATAHAAIDEGGISLWFGAKEAAIAPVIHLPWGRKVYVRESPK